MFLPSENSRNLKDRYSTTAETTNDGDYGGLRIEKRITGTKSVNLFEDPWDQSNSAVLNHAGKEEKRSPHHRRKNEESKETYNVHISYVTHEIAQEATV
ncbi:hypothetical protein CHS0354_019155 [Potamilus streckersoni]|uniref:Uncharacterized protein n=1 Tax=Potamilus streckersoni TaxID=2493646 RepID=A0AAE0W4G3_9BIVA|nr:hypothetical protein CHS0354_019155 [Potamilus streckersoni]